MWVSNCLLTWKPPSDVKGRDNGGMLGGGPSGIMGACRAGTSGIMGACRAETIMDNEGMLGRDHQE